jgi:hypothetical protein
MSKKNIAAFACWVATFTALFVIFRAGHPVHAHLAHSDALYLPVLFDDMFKHGGRFADWFLTPAPYFFPDMALYGVAWLAGSNAFTQTMAFALLQTWLTALVLYLLARHALAHGRLLAAAALSVMFVWLGLHLDDPFVRIFTSAHHYGAFIVALLLCALWLDQDTGRAREHNSTKLALIAGLVFLTTLSDALFLAQTALPLLATAVLLRHGAPKATAPRRALLLVLAPALAGLLSYRFVVTHPTRFPTKLSLAQLPPNLTELGNILATLFGGRPVLTAAIALSLGVGVACIVASLRRRVLPGLPRPLQLLTVFATLSCLATVAALLLTKDLLPVPRYLIGALSWPLVAGLFVLVDFLGARYRHGGVALCLALCLAFSALLVIEAWRVRDVRDTDRHFYREQVACIDRTLGAAGARYGMAHYWDAKRLQGLSRLQLTMAQYTSELGRMEWITSERFYRDSYDFAIVAEQDPVDSALSRARLVAINGEPAQTVTCVDRTVLLYGPGRLRQPAAAQ